MDVLTGTNSAMHSSRSQVDDNLLSNVLMILYSSDIHCYATLLRVPLQKRYLLEISPKSLIIYIQIHFKVFHSLILYSHTHQHNIYNLELQMAWS